MESAWSAVLSTEVTILQIRDICFSCLAELIEDSDNLDSRLLSALKHNMSTYGAECYRCEKQCNCAVNVSTCDTCAKSESSNKKKDICFECYTRWGIRMFADSTDTVLMCLDCLNSKCNIFADKFPDLDGSNFMPLNTHYSSSGLICYSCKCRTNIYVDPYVCDDCADE